MLFLSVLIYLDGQAQLRHRLVCMKILEQWSIHPVEIVFFYDIGIDVTVCEGCSS